MQAGAVCLDLALLHLAVQGGVGREVRGLRRERGRARHLGRVQGTSTPECGLENFHCGLVVRLK